MKLEKEKQTMPRSFALQIILMFQLTIYLDEPIILKQIIKRSIHMYRPFILKMWPHPAQQALRL